MHVLLQVGIAPIGKRRSKDLKSNEYREFHDFHAPYICVQQYATLTNS